MCVGGGGWGAISVQRGDGGGVGWGGVGWGGVEAISVQYYDRRRATMAVFGA